MIYTVPHTISISFIDAGTLKANMHETLNRIHMGSLRGERLSIVVDGLTIVSTICYTGSVFMVAVNETDFILYLQVIICDKDEQKAETKPSQVNI